MSWLNGELILNGMSKKDLAYAHDYIRSTVRNNGDTEEFPNLGENLLPIVQRKIICKSYEDAKELADSLNWEREYNLLIPFKDVDNIKETKKMKNLHERIKKEETKLNEYVKKTDCKNYKSKFVGCPRCGSRLNRKSINNDKCPLCGQDISSSTVKKTIKRYKNNIKEMEKELRKEKEKLSYKAKTKYLFLYEEDLKY